MRRWLRWSAAVALLLILTAVGFFTWFVLWPVHNVPALEPVSQYTWLDQGWVSDQNSEFRQTWYYTPQGTSMPQGASAGAMRYDWFVHLEQPLSTERFAAPDHMRKYRFLVDPEPSQANPDQLPIGFTRHFEPAIGEDVLDITCSACHTGEIQHTAGGKTTAIRIDGGQAMHAFTDMSRGSFAPELLAALINTTYSPWKFDRFAKNVLGPGYPRARPQLKTALKATISAMLASGQNNPLRKLYPVHEGYGRTDALGRIGNTAFGDHLVPANYQDGDAPVSYPYVWNIWKFDWVQYNGSVSQPLARNVGEALGVGAISPLRSSMLEPLPPAERLRSSVDIAGLQKIEHALQLLRPPTWPENILGPIDHDKAAKGQALFEKRCQMCHGPHVADAARAQASAPQKPAGMEWRIEVIPLEHIGTDPTAAMGFMERRYDLAETGLGNDDLKATLRPLFTRALARDARFRLIEVIRLLTEAKQPVGDLPAVLAAYPDPDANPWPVLPTATFSAIDAALTKAIPTPPVVPGVASRPPDPPECEFDCHLLNLLWDVRNGGAGMERTLGTLDVAKLSEGLALNLVGILIKERFYKDYGIDYATQQCLEGFGALDLPQEIAGYKPRPLAGVWATPPFLHNGSVPTLYQMLLPPEQRDAKFFVGRREYDTVHGGYVTAPDADGDADGFWLDTSIPGNHNSGHAFSADAATWSKYLADPKANPLPKGVIGPLLTDDERYAIVEYLKIHRDLPETPPDYRPPRCRLFGRDL